MATGSFKGFAKVIQSFKKAISSSARVSEIDPHGEAEFPEKKFKVSTAESVYPKEVLYPRTIPFKADVTKEQRDKEIEAAADLFESIESKFQEFDEIVESVLSEFFIQFDPIKYPEVSEAVLYFTDGKLDNYINKKTYNLAKSDYQDGVVKNISRYSAAIEGKSVASIQQQINQKKKFNVLKAAFRSILDQLEDWFYNIPVVRTAMGFFRKKRPKSKPAYVNIGGYVMPMSQTRTESVSLDDVETLTRYAIILLEYVYGVIIEREDAIKYNFGPNKDAILFELSMQNSRTIFNSLGDMVSGIIDRDSVRQIGGNSPFHSDALSQAIKEVDRDSQNLELLLQGDYLQALDKALARLIRTIRGWYLDPETYCCLINAFGGIATTVPKWLKNLRFALEIAITGCDLDLELNSKRLNNLLGLIISSALGTIITSLSNSLEGWMNKQEIAVMQSILNSKSKLARCLPLDDLVSEFSNILSEMEIELKTLLTELGNKLDMSVGTWEVNLNLYERKKRLSIIWNILDKFIKTWEAGYICTKSEAQPKYLAKEKRYSPPATISGFPFDNVKEDGTLIEDAHVVTKAEMKYFAGQVLKLRPDIMKKILISYDSPGDACSEGWSTTDLAELRDKINELQTQ